jgi:hypothetical protein
VSVFFDWAPDGRTLVYAGTDQPDPAGVSRWAYLSDKEEPFVYRRQHMPEVVRGTHRMGYIFTCTTVNEDGSLAKERPGGAVAVVAYADALPLRCLKTGRVLFAGPEVRLPEPAGTDAKLALFTAALDKPYDVKAVPLPDAKPRAYDRLDLFQLSPDEARVAVLNPQGRAAVMDLATGKVDSGSATRLELPAGLPAWRSNEELCFVAEVKDADGAKSRPQVVLQTRDGVRVLSKDWPDAVRRGWLDR